MTDEELMRQFEEQDGFIKHNNIKVISFEKGKSAVLEAKLTKESLNPFGFAHGGIIFGLGDTAMGVAVISSGRNAVTLTSSITYLKPSKGSTLRAEAEMVKDGKQVCYLKCNFYDENDILTASMDASYYYTN